MAKRSSAAGLAAIVFAIFTSLFSLTAAAQITCPGAGGEDGNAGFAPALVADGNGGNVICSSSSGAYGTLQPRDEIDGNRRFVAVLPDAAPAISGAKFAIGDGSTAQIIQQVNCSGATISGVGSDQVTLALADGQSCALEIIGNRYRVTFTGATLSRSGAVYRLTSGALNGGPFGGVVPKPNLDVTDVTGAIDIPNNRNATPTTENGTDFGDVLVGAQASRTYRVVNNGDAALTLLNNPVRLDNRTAFSIETNLTAGDILEPGASRTFTLRFAPQSAGVKTALITLVSDDADDDTHQFVIRGNGLVVPEIAVAGPGGPVTDGGTDAVGDLPVGAAVARTYTVSNSGNVPLEVSQIAASGASNVAIGAISPTNVVVAPGSSETFSVSFTPLGGGPLGFQLALESNDPDANPYDIAVSGTGTGEAEIAVAGPAGPIADGGADATGDLPANAAVTRTYTVSNGGNLPLDVTQITAAGAANVQVGAITPASLVVAPGQSETFSVSFTPIDGGAFGFQLALVSNDADASPFDIAVSGTATAPELAVASVTAGPLGGGGGSDPQGDQRAGVPVDLTYTVTNPGSQTLEIASISVGGETNAAVDAPVPGALSVAPGGSATFQVRYVPQSAGVFGFDIVLASNDTDESTYAIAVSGNGATPEIDIAGPGGGAIASGATDVAGDAAAGGETTRTYTVANMGTATLVVSAITVSEAVNVAVRITPAQLTVAAGGSETFEVAYMPAGGGPFAFTLQVQSDDADEPTYDIRIEGNGLAPEISVSGNGADIQNGDASPGAPDGTDFGVVIDNAGAVVRTFTITNDGNGELVLGASPTVRLTGADASQFAVVRQPAATIPAGGSTTLEVAFDPPGRGARRAEIVIENNDGDEAPFIFAVQGTGQAADLVPPEVVITAPSRVRGPFEATVTFSEPVTGFAPGNLAITNGAPGAAFVSQTGTTYVVEIAPTDHGEVTVRVPEGAAQDDGGNANRASATVAVNYIDEAYVRQRTGRVIANFMSRRADHITAEEPDITGRLSGSGGQGGAGPVAFTGSGTGANNRFAFATSLRQIAQAEAQEKRARLAGLGAGPMGLGYGSLDGPAIVESGFDIWVQGKWARADSDTAESTIGLLYVGADYRFSNDFVAGFMAQFDWTDQNESLANIRAEGTGWMAGPYVAARLHENLIFDVRAAWGQSSNSVSPFGTYTDDFDGERWLAKAQFTGDFAFGDVKFAPHVAVIYFEEQQKAYTDSLGVRIPGQTVSLGRFTFGPKVSTTYRAADGSALAPYLAVKGIWDFDPARLVDLETGAPSGSDRLRGRVEGGISFSLPSGLSLTAEGAYDGIGASDFEAYGGSVTVTIPLQGPARVPPG